MTNTSNSSVSSTDKTCQALCLFPYKFIVKSRV